MESTERDSFKIYRVGLRALDDNLQGIDGINWYYYDVRLEVQFITKGRLHDMTCRVGFSFCRVKMTAKAIN